MIQSKIKQEMRATIFAILAAALYAIYIMAQKDLGAAKTSAYYSVAPFLGVAFSLLFVGERPTIKFYVALVIMIISTIIMTKDTLELN